MANEHIGRLVSVGVAPEASRGAYATPDYWIPKSNVTLIEQTEELEDENSVGRIETPKGMDISREWSEGDIEGTVRDNSVGVFLYGLFGSLNTSTDDPEADANTHTFTVNNTNTAKSLSLTVKDEVTQRAFKNCMVNTFSMEAATDSYVNMTVGVIGANASDVTRTPSYTEESRFRPQDVAVKLASSVAGLSGASETTFESLTLTVTKNVEAHWNLGSTYPDEIFNKQMIVEGSLTRLYDGTTQRDLALTNSSTDAMSIKLEHADDVIGATSTAPSLEFQVMGCDFREWNLERGNDDMVVQTIAFKGFYSLGESGMLKAILINGVTSY